VHGKDARAPREIALGMILRRVSVISLALVLVAVAPAPSSAQRADPYEQAKLAPAVSISEPQPASPAADGLLPRTGLGAGWIALLGGALLMLGVRLRVISRIRAVVRRYAPPRTKLRESLEELRAAGVEEQRRRAELGPQVEPSTPTARRVADVR
jgi:hypothetical protein